jgi:hypothetical protein
MEKKELKREDITEVNSLLLDFDSVKKLQKEKTIAFSLGHGLFKVSLPDGADTTLNNSEQIEKKFIEGIRSALHEYEINIRTVLKMNYGVSP